jgi:hypothetical protein
MSAAPAVQASYMKNLFAALEAQGRLAPLVSAAPELLRAVESAPRVSWLPIARNVEMVEAAARAFGEERGLALLADCVYRQLDTPLWKGFIGGAVRLLGTEPGSLGRWIPEAMGLVFRGCGRWRAEPSTGPELTVSVVGLPPALAAHPLWLRSLAVGIGAPLFTLCGVSGSSALAERDERAGSARFRIQWKAASGR